jgi:hypothetical protein
MVDSNAGTPRWVKISLVITALLVVLLLALLVFGEGHGPKRHMPSRSQGGSSMTSTRSEAFWR